MSGRCRPCTWERFTYNYSRREAHYTVPVRLLTIPGRPCTLYLVEVSLSTWERLTTTTRRYCPLYREEHVTIPRRGWSLYLEEVCRYRIPGRGSPLYLENVGYYTWKRLATIPRRGCPLYLEDIIYYT
jgi:hypothetical protein